MRITNNKITQESWPSQATIQEEDVDSSYTWNTGLANRPGNIYLHSLTFRYAARCELILDTRATIYERGDSAVLGYATLSINNEGYFIIEFESYDHSQIGTLKATCAIDSNDVDIILQSPNTLLNGNATIVGDAHVLGDVNIAGEIISSSNATIQGDLNITGGMTLGGSLTIPSTGSISIKSFDLTNAKVVGEKVGTENGSTASCDFAGQLGNFYIFIFKSETVNIKYVAGLFHAGAYLGTIPQYLTTKSELINFYWFYSSDENKFVINWSTPNIYPTNPSITVYEIPINLTIDNWENPEN